MGPLMGTNKAACGVKLLLTTVSAYQVDCGCFCAILNTQHRCLSPCGWSFVDPVKPRRSTTGSMGPLMGTNKAACGVKLLLTTVSAYQVDCGCFCAILNTQHRCLSPCGWSFDDPVEPRRSTTGSMGPLMGTNKAACGVKLLLTTVSAYQVDCGCFCAILNTQHRCLSPCGWYYPPSASHPPPAPTPPLSFPPPPTRHPPPPINFIHDIAGVVKNYHKNQQC